MEPAIGASCTKRPVVRHRPTRKFKPGRLTSFTASRPRCAQRIDRRQEIRGSMSNLLDLLVAGLATGAIYAIVATGFTLLWQTSQTINFAQGEFVMLPAFLRLEAMHAGAPFWLAILIVILLSLVLLGLGFKMLLVDPMLRHGVLPLAIATMALALGIKEAVKQFFSAEASPFPSIVPAGDVDIL